MKTTISTSNAPAAIGPYSQALKVNGMLFTSGQIALSPKSGELITEDICAETRQVMQNLAAILTEASMTFEDVVKTSIFLKDMDDFEAVNKVYASYFTNNLPARETIQVAKLPKDVNIEISMIAIDSE